MQVNVFEITANSIIHSKTYSYIEITDNLAIQPTKTKTSDVIFTDTDRPNKNDTTALANINSSFQYV